MTQRRSYLEPWGVELAYDEWVEEWSLIEPRKLHAIGVIALQWSVCERNLRMLFTMAAELSADDGLLVTYDLPNSRIWEKLQALVRRKVSNDFIDDDLKWYAKQFDICSNNRNALVHASLRTFDELVLAKRTDSFGKLLPSDLGRFRMVAEDNRRLAASVEKLALYFLYSLRGEHPTWPGRYAQPPNPLLSAHNQTSPKPR